ncbi:sensor histidine kinase [Phytoactinopolyspora alkaliphila]|uniref:histidine kinase n=1 Tax=Phytoactinopolyspora alkaliphila TaxID=1783498 RepID=A0A6N9YHI0_9ACTN|nr:GAF domain-containing sensor histidine kinase [Phytoactinopolyspora alkaliphila]NED94412.1 sensor histidine kinase [Phytoactinopolyspora alkaliphila]
MSRIQSERARSRRDVVLWIGWLVLVTVTVAVAVWALRILLDVPERMMPYALGGLLALPFAGAALFSARGRRRAGTVFAPTLVVSGVLLMVLAVYLVVVVGLGDGVEGDEHRILSLSIVAGLISLLLTGPARTRLGELADGVVGARRRPPKTVLETFGTRMSRAVPMDELLLQLTETLRSTMGPVGAEVWTGSDGVLERTVSVPEQPRTRIALSGPELTAVSAARVSGNAWAEVWLPQVLIGRPEGTVLRIAPITHLGRLLGLLTSSRAADSPGFTDEDDRVLTELARQVGLALHNVSLDTALQASLEELRQRNEELQASRARIVSAADASRRQIERDIHDGAQQRLVAIAVKIALARRLVDGSAPQLSAMLDELRGDAQDTLTELRDLAHGIYPPLLREHGLPEALRNAANRSTVPATIENDLERRFGPQLESAVYFCCLEAMQNAGKHAGEGAQLVIRLADKGTTLLFEVADDGLGFDPVAAKDRAGFVNMRDRVGAFGGRLEVESSTGSGTVVRGQLPVPAPDEST